MTETAKWAWNSIKYYAQTSYYMAFIYGRIRGMVQPWVSTDFNVNKIEDGVYIGDISSAYNEEELKKLGITHIITAVLGVGPQFPNSFKYLCVPVRDVESEDIQSHLTSTTTFINNVLKENGKVLIHCICGVSRSATIVAAWVMSQHGYTVQETIDILQAQRPCVNPNPSFRDQLEEYRNEV